MWIQVRMQPPDLRSLPSSLPSLAFALLGIIAIAAILIALTKAKGKMVPLYQLPIDIEEVEETLSMYGIACEKNSAKDGVFVKEETKFLARALLAEKGLPLVRRNAKMTLESSKIQLKEELRSSLQEMKSVSIAVVGLDIDEVRGHCGRVHIGLRVSEPIDRTCLQGVVHLSCALIPTLSPDNIRVSDDLGFNVVWYPFENVERWPPHKSSHPDNSGTK